MSPWVSRLLIALVVVACLAGIVWAFTLVETNDGSNDIANAIRPFLAGLDPSRVTIAADWLDGDNDVENRVRVTVSTTWQPLMLFIFGSNPFTLSASSTMPIAH